MSSLVNGIQSVVPGLSSLSSSIPSSITSAIPSSITSAIPSSITSVLPSSISSYLPSSTSSTSSTPSETSGVDSTKSFLDKGFLVPLWAHLLLTGLLPGSPLIPVIGPILFSFFNTLGANGGNLLVTNSLSWATAKFGLNQMLNLIASLIEKRYPRKFWAQTLKNFLRYFNPWFVFDWIQVVGALLGLNEPFKTIGYKIPFWNKQTDSALKHPIKMSKLTTKSIGFRTLDENKKPILDSKGNLVISYGLLSTIPIAVILGIFALSISSMTANIPPELTADITPFINKLFWYIGIATAAIGGTLGTTGLIALMPKVMTFINPPAPAVVAAAPAVAAMSGGGTNIPTVKEIAESLLNKGTPVQGGGAKEESTAFMGILGFLIFGGVTLAFVRRKINDSN